VQVMLPSDGMMVVGQLIEAILLSTSDLSEPVLSSRLVTT
jgi:hypothetical protein